MRRWSNCMVVVLLLATLSVTAEAKEGVFPLTLKDAIKMAVEKNLDVKAELYNAAFTEADIERSKGIYNPVFSLLAGYKDTSTPRSYIVNVQDPINRQKDVVVKTGISQLISSGGIFEVSYEDGWNQNNAGASGITNMDNYFRSNFTLSFSQPLLKNFGRETNELSINVSKFNKEGELEQFKSKLQEIVSRVMTQYYKMYSVHKNLEVKRSSFTLAEKIFSNTKNLVNEGVLPSMELLNAQLGVSIQKKNLIDAERAFKDQTGELCLLLQLDRVNDIIPTDTPLRDEYKVDESQLIQSALKESPNLKQLRVSLKNSELKSRVAESQLLPLLDVVSSATLTGLADSYSQDLDQVSSGRYPNLFVGLKLVYPIGNDSAKNDSIKSKLKIEQIRTQVRSYEESIKNDVGAAVRAVDFGFLQLNVTAQGRVYAEEVLQAYIEKQKSGLATTKDVLDSLNNLVTEQGKDIQAVTDYNNAIVTLWKTTGELLKQEGITLGKKESEALYNNKKEEQLY